jgi:hypothetical protein
MKGKISTRLDAVLRDPNGRAQLKTHLLRGTNGRVMAGSKEYSLRVDVRDSIEVSNESAVIRSKDHTATKDSCTLDKKP